MSVQAFDNLNLLLQLMQATRNLATGFRRAASDNLAMAQASPPAIALADLQSNIANLGNSVQSTLATARTWVQNNNAQATAAVGLIGASLADLNTYVSPIQTAVNNLQAADVSTYAACITALQAVLSTVPAPNTVFGT